VYRPAGGDEELWHIKCTFEDGVYRVMNRWFSGLDVDGDGEPEVTAVFTPSVEDVTSGRCPPDAMVPGILREASSVVHHYAALTDEEVAAGAAHHHRRRPSIPGPLVVPVAFTRVRNANVALHALLDRLHTMNDPIKYPTLTSIKGGAYVCTLGVAWPNAVHEVVLFKRHGMQRS
jgi:hypothetical protein